MPKPKRWALTFLWTFPVDIVVWMMVVAVLVLWGAKLFWLDGLWVELRAKSFPDKQWGSRWLGVTLGHGGILAAGRAGGPGADTKTERHELVHVEQFEANMLTGFVLGLLCAVTFLVDGCQDAALVSGLLVWILSWPLGYAAAAAQAYLRGEDQYSGNHLEESAYCQAGKAQDEKDR